MASRRQALGDQLPDKGQHDEAVEHGDARQRDEPDRGGDRERHVAQPQGRDAAGEGERHGAEHQQRVARAIPSAEQQQEDQRKAQRHDDHEALPRRREDSRTVRPRSPNSRAASVTSAATLACASSTIEPMSRPRTSAVTTTRRLPFSRLIWFGPSEELKSASCAQRDRWRPVRLGGGRQRNREVLQRLDIVTQERPEAARRSGSGGRLRTPRRPPGRPPRCRSRPARRRG